MPTTIGRRASSVQEIPLDDELTLFDPASGTALALNRTARAIWQRADGTTSIDVVIAELAEQFGIAASDIHDDVVATLRTLTEAGVLVSPT